jgi:hypothetical protein
MSPIAFLRAYPQRPDTLCTESMLAWLESRGLNLKGLDGAAQRESYARLGFSRSLISHARWLGIELRAASLASEGDAVVCRLGAELLCGVLCEDRIVAIASYGRLTLAPFPLVRALHCPP